MTTAVTAGPDWRTERAVGGLPLGAQIIDRGGNLLVEIAQPIRRRPVRPPARMTMIMSDRRPPGPGTPCRECICRVPSAGNPRPLKTGAPARVARLAGKISRCRVGRRTAILPPVAWRDNNCPAAVRRARPGTEAGSSRRQGILRVGHRRRKMRAARAMPDRIQPPAAENFAARPKCARYWRPAS